MNISEPEPLMGSQDFCKVVMSQLPRLRNFHSCDSCSKTIAWQIVCSCTMYAWWVGRIHCVTHNTNYCRFWWKWIIFHREICFLVFPLISAISNVIYSFLNASWSCSSVSWLCLEQQQEECCCLQLACLLTFLVLFDFCFHLASFWS